MLTFNTYIIRLYKCDKDRPEELLGLLEDIETGQQKVFKNMDELWEIISLLEKSRKAKDQLKSKKTPFPSKKT